MSSEDKESQDNELLALESIYDGRQFKRCCENGGEVSIFLELPSDLKVCYPTQVLEEQNREAEDLASPRQVQIQDIQIDHFPPLMLNFMYPEEYPSASPPSFSLSCKWLNVIQLSRLCKTLDQIWEDQGPGFEIIFQWVQFLTEETVSVLKIESPFELSVISQKRLQKLCENNDSAMSKKIDSRAFQDAVSIPNLIPYLEDYSVREKKRIFETSYFDCAVCFLEKRGSDCVKFLKCGHIYCKECMREYFLVQIRDGAVRALTCPEEKCDSQADPGLVQQLVPSDMFEKYDRYLLQSTLDCMGDITYCPRKECQTPVLKEEDDLMAICSNCQYVFCALCKRCYHSISPCPINATELLKIRDIYLKGTPEERADLERKYGKKRLENAVSEHYSEVWLESNAKRCPNCKTQIQKIDGCNKMTCYKCQTHFCWLCGKSLPGSDPYSHFNTKDGGCFNRLFEGVEQNAHVDFDEDEDEWLNLHLNEDWGW